MNKLKVCGWLFVLACGFLSIGVHAHTWGTPLLPAAADAAITFSVACFNDGNGDAARLFFNVQGNTSAAPYYVALAVRKTQDNGEVIQAGPVVDTNNADTKPSPSESLYGGNGTYFLTISKTPRQPGGSTTGRMSYSFNFHCETESGAHTGTQEQPTVITAPVDPVDPVDPEIPTQPVNPKVSSFSGSLSKVATEKRYLVACSPKAGQSTARYWFSIRGATKNRPFLVKLTANKDGVEKVVGDANNNDAEYGEWGYIEPTEGGDGPYTLSIGKVSDAGLTQGTMAFKVRHSCEAAKGLRTKISGAKAIK